MKRVYLLLVLLACGLGLSALYVDKFSQVFEEMGAWTPGTGLAWWAIPVAVACQVLAHCLRARNAQDLLRVVRPSGFMPVFSGMSIGFLFNALLPFRLGELVRAHVTGKQLAISRGVVFLTILFERAVDGLLLGACAVLAWLVWPGERPPVMRTLLLLAGGVGLVSVAVSLLLLVLYRQDTRLLRWLGRWTSAFNDRIRDRGRFLLWSVIYGLHVVFRSARLGRYVATAALTWVLYLASMAALVQGFLPASPLLPRLTVAISAYLSVSVPSGPGFLGTFHYYFSELARGLLGTDGVPLAMSLVCWSVLIVPFALVGLGLLFSLRASERRSLEAEPLESMKNKLHRDADITPELSHFLDEYFSGAELSHLLSAQEMGGNFRIIKTFKGGSNASTLLVWEDKKLQVKKFTLRQHADKLKTQYDWLRRYSNLRHLPQVPQETHGRDFYAFNIEYRENFIPFFQYIHSESTEKSRRIIDGVLDFMYGNIYELRERVHAREDLERYVDDKVINKVRDAAALNLQLASLVDLDTLVINGRRYDNLHVSVERLRRNARALQELSTVYHTPIHGDLTVDNIIVSRQDDHFLVLDPNNENTLSDPVVDLGKLYQSLHSGYEFLCQLPTARVEGNALQFEEIMSSRYSELFTHLQRVLSERLPPETLRTVLFHEAVHYCRMLTYRARINPATLPAFYATAVKLFHEFNAQYE